MRHFNGTLRGGPHRSRRGLVMGVCRGLAEHFDFSVFWVRAITVMLLILSGFWPVFILYFVAVLVMKPEPVVSISNDDEQEFYDSYVHSREGAVARLKRRYESLNRRIQRIEDAVTAREFDWDRKING